MQRRNPLNTFDLITIVANNESGLTQVSGGGGHCESFQADTCFPLNANLSPSSRGTLKSNIVMYKDNMRGQFIPFHEYSNNTSSKSRGCERNPNTIMTKVRELAPQNGLNVLQEMSKFRAPEIHFPWSKLLDVRSNPTLLTTLITGFCFCEAAKNATTAERRSKLQCLRYDIAEHKTTTAEEPRPIAT